MSVLALAWQENEDIEAFIRSFKGVKYPHKQLVLAVGGIHKVEDYARFQDPEVIVIRHPGGIGKNRGLAACLERSSGEIVLVTDSDCALSTHAFLRLITPLINDGERAATGQFRPQPDQEGNLTVQMQWAFSAYEAATAPRYIGGMRGRNFALTRQVLDAVGGFEPDKLADDYYLSLKLRRAGHQIRFVGDSQVETFYQESTADYVRQQERWRRGIIEQRRNVLGVRQSLRTLGWPLVASALLGLTASLPVTRGSLVSRCSYRVCSIFTCRRCAI